MNWRVRNTSAAAVSTRVLLSLLVAGAVSACASSGRTAVQRPPRVEVATLPVEPADTTTGPATAPNPAAEPLPPLAVSQIEEPTSRRSPRLSLLEAEGEDLRMVLRGVAESFGLEYQIHPEVRGRVSTRLRDVTLREALDAIVLPQGYTYQLEDGVLRVGPAQLTTRIYSLDYIALNRVGVGTTIIQRRLGTGGTTGQFGGAVAGGAGALGRTGVTGQLGGAVAGADVITSIEVANLWQELQVSLEGLVFDAVTPEEEAGQQPAVLPGAQAPGAYSRVAEDGRRLIINPLAGTVLVTADPARLAEVEAFIETIEASIQRQVLIEAKIVEVSLDEQFQFGIDWSALKRFGDLGVQFQTGGGQAGAEVNTVELTLGAGEEGVGAVLQALDRQGDVRVLSSPRVAAVNNQRAVINISTDEVFFTVTRQPLFNEAGQVIRFQTEIVPQQVAVGIVLDVFPQIASNNTITMNIRPVVTDVVRVEEVELEDGTQARAPVIDRRETDTVVRVRDGETVVIGGLMQTRERVEERGVPVLKDIPLLGRLFRTTERREEKRELVIFLTPTIVAGQPQVGG